MSPGRFFSEADAYPLLERAGLRPPRRGWAGDAPPFRPGEPVVLKGLGEELWHKSELGGVRFCAFDAARLAEDAQAMRIRIEAAGHRWLGGLVCERIRIARQAGLPAEALVSLAHGPGGPVVIFGFGGLQAEALTELAPALCWPCALVAPDHALAELQAHLLGRIWLGRLRGLQPLTTPGILRAFLAHLWRLAGLLEAEQLDLLELNPVVLDEAGEPRPLDAVGRRREPVAPRWAPPAGFLRELRAPGRVALAGVSAQPGGIGRTILENLQRHSWPEGDLRLIKPGPDRLLGLPCVPDVGALRARPVDLLVLALPAPAAVDSLLKLLDQGGGAAVVAVVSGGIGDGADRSGLAEKLAARLRADREGGRWTPAVLGPNFLGHWVPGTDLDTSFIPVEKLAAPGRPGPLTLLSQSGAFLLSRRSHQPALPFELGLALGNQLDVSAADVLAELAAEESGGPVALYLEGFGPGHLELTVAAVRRLRQRGRCVVLHRAGRTAAGQAAAATHTGAIAGDLARERALLTAAGARLTDSLAAFDSALTWLGAHPTLSAGPVGVVTNAGFESVNAADAFGARLPGAECPPGFEARLRPILERHGLAGLVSPRLPLDLTPMADEAAFLESADLVLESVSVLVVGLVPFTRRLRTAGAGAAESAAAWKALAAKHGKPVAIAVDAGAGYEDLRTALASAGLPVFSRLEDALLGLRALR